MTPEKKAAVEECTNQQIEAEKRLISRQRQTGTDTYRTFTPACLCLAVSRLYFLCQYLLACLLLDFQLLSIVFIVISKSMSTFVFLARSLSQALTPSPHPAPTRHTKGYQDLVTRFGRTDFRTFTLPS